MNTTLSASWLERLACLDHAFQPITRFASGEAYGFEALLRGWDRAGFADIATVFDLAFEERVLYAVDLALRRKAFAKFGAAAPAQAKLFYNVDNRLLEMPDYATGNTLSIARECGLSPSRIVIELSELHEPAERTGFDQVVESYRKQGFRIALDDFGSGYAGLKFLHRAEPDIVKIDRYFVASCGEDPRKAAFLEKIASMAHLMGISVVAEGVETEREFLICAEAGCDLAQGYHIARPSLAATELRATYVPPAARRGAPASERRSTGQAGVVGRERLSETEEVGLGVALPEVLARFRKEPGSSLLPVVDANGEVAGVYRERDFREYVYSPFGIAILEHLAAESGGQALLVKAPVAPVGADLARVVELYGASPDSGGVVMTEGGRYAGILRAEDLLSLVAERELVEARDQNPLTRLPGNVRIAEVCADRLAAPGRGVAFAYFDFDNFKPYNDLYGFRNGDRVIMLFADILRGAFGRPGDFAGHLGGDDFFACVEASAPAESQTRLLDAASRFAREAASFYAPEDRERGWIMGKDRDGVERRMSLLTVSVAVVILEAGGQLDAERLSETLAELKREAKGSRDRMASRVVGPGAEPRGPGPSGGAEPPATGDEPAAPLPFKERRGPPHPIFTPSLIAAF